MNNLLDFHTIEEVMICAHEGWVNGRVLGCKCKRGVKRKSGYLYKDPRDFRYMSFADALGPWEPYIMDASEVNRGDIPRCDRNLTLGTIDPLRYLGNQTG